MMSRRASFDIFQGNATLFLFRDAFAPHRRDSACTDELAAPAPASLKYRRMVTPTGIEPVFQP